MQKSYQIDKPEEFGIVIADILYYQKMANEDILVVTLQGDLGAGKTTFTQELGKVLGVSEPIVSPTFTIMKSYELEHEQFDTLVHIDAYRFESEEEARPLRLEEVFSTARAIVCVEWPERISSLIPKTAVSVAITITEGEKRQVVVSYPERGGLGG
jgi:tRNA threonylcarbamoyladenosine biosynthesis protein TsaE